jgi:hypothetical protein
MTRIIQARMVSTAMARKLKVWEKVKAKGNDDELSDLGAESDFGQIARAKVYIPPPKDTS